MLMIRGMMNLWPTSVCCPFSLVNRAIIGLKDTVLDNGDVTGTRVLAYLWRDGEILALGLGYGREVKITSRMQHM